jgi:glyoxylase-like metal-dependent hydrolase (beta-lactamase superfamily II)
MKKGAAETIARGVFLVGGAAISHVENAASFVIDCGPEMVMVDCGAGPSVRTILEKIEGAGFDSHRISTVILTHNHIDHAGGAGELRTLVGCRIVIHALDAAALEEGDSIRTAANWYGIDFPPTPVDRRLTAGAKSLPFGEEIIHCLHTPGYTPGSMAIYLDRDGQRILFGQDIHGPFVPEFASDIDQWRNSMEKLLALKADILCEVHFGIFNPGDRVEQYIRRCLRQNGR